MTSDEVRLVQAEIAAGRNESFFRIVQEHGLLVRSWIGAHIYRADEVDDLAQEAFIAAFRSISSFRPDEDLGAWLRGIARNVLSHHFRSRKRRQAAMDEFRQQLAEAVSVHIDDNARSAAHDDVEALLRCIASLPERLRQVVRAGLDGAKPAALAEQLSTSVSAVYNLHWRANQLLRDCVRKEQG